jgi:nitrogenase subunit NifH
MKEFLRFVFSSKIVSMMMVMIAFVMMFMDKYNQAYYFIFMAIYFAINAVDDTINDIEMTRLKSMLAKFEITSNKE